MRRIFCIRHEWKHSLLAYNETKGQFLSYYCKKCGATKVLDMRAIAKREARRDFERSKVE